MSDRVVNIKNNLILFLLLASVTGKHPFIIQATYTYNVIETKQLELINTASTFNRKLMKGKTLTFLFHFVCVYLHLIRTSFGQTCEQKTIPNP